MWNELPSNTGLCERTNLTEVCEYRVLLSVKTWPTQRDRLNFAAWTDFKQRPFPQDRIGGFLKLLQLWLHWFHSQSLFARYSIRTVIIVQVRDQHPSSYPLLLGDQQGAATKLAGEPCLVDHGGQGDSSKTDKCGTIFTFLPCLLWRVRHPVKRFCWGCLRLYCSSGKQHGGLSRVQQRREREVRKEEVS